MRACLAVSFVIVGCIFPSAAIAWGIEGHRVVALIAASELTPAAKAQVEALLGGEASSSMANIANWSDEVRPQRPETAPWHYVDIPIGSMGYDLARDCKNNDCIVAQIVKNEQILADKSLLPPVRAEALKYLIHFVGDIHQPLHSSNNNDHGGSDMRVSVNGRQTTLHRVWENLIPASLGPDEASIVSRLETKMTLDQRRRWGSNDPGDWANEGFALAGKEIYPALSSNVVSVGPIVLETDYVAHHQATVEMQLEKAGLRLAAAINTLFGPRRFWR